MKINLGKPPNLNLANGAMERIGAEMDEVLSGEVTLDGLTGEPIRTIVDGEEAEVRFADPQQPLIEVSTEQLIHELSVATQNIKDAKRAKKAAVQHLKDCQDRLTDIADALCERDAPQQAELAFDDGEPLDGDGDN